MECITYQQWNTAISRAIGKWRRSHVARRTAFPTNATVSNNLGSVICELTEDSMFVKEGWRKAIYQYVGANARVLIA